MHSAKFAMSGPDLCPKCKGLHFKNAPCIVRKFANVAQRKSKQIIAEDAGSTPATGPDAPKRPRGRPKTITDMRAYKAEKQRKYRAEKKAGIR